MTGPRARRANAESQQKSFPRAELMLSLGRVAEKPRLSGSARPNRRGLRFGETPESGIMSLKWWVSIGNYLHCSSCGGVIQDLNGRSSFLDYMEVTGFARLICGGKEKWERCTRAHTHCKVKDGEDMS